MANVTVLVSKACRASTKRSGPSLASAIKDNSFVVCCAHNNWNRTVVVVYNSCAGQSDRIGSIGKKTTTIWNECDVWWMPSLSAKQIDSGKSVADRVSAASVE